MAGFTLPPKSVGAWYAYAFACEVFSACALAIFLPITLEHMAREVGFLAPDLNIPCTNSDNTVQSENGVSTVCKAKILGVWVDTASFSMYVKSMAVALQAICIITVGPVADSPYWRKRLLLTFAYLGSFSAVAFLFFPSGPSNVIPVVAALLTIIGNGGYALGVVCSNAFLPVLAREDEKVREALKGFTGDDQNELRDGDLRLSDEDPREGSGIALRPSIEEERHLLPLPIIQAISTTDLMDSSTVTDTSYTHILSLTTSRLSSTATALGFLSAFSVLTLLLIPVTILKGSTRSLCLAIGLSGIWWGVFTIPAWVGLPSGERDVEIEGSRAFKSWYRWLSVGWGRVGEMIRPSEIRELRDLYTYLLAWIFLSDGFHTVTYTAILYASSTLSMPASKVILLGILVLFFAFVSSIFSPYIQKRINRSNHRLLLYLVLAGEVIPIYACLGLVLPFGGLKTETEMYVVSAWFGLLYGPFNSYSRAVYAELIPPGHESTFFSLFSLTDKSASFLGPLVVGLIADLTGNIRLGFVFLLVMLAVPIPVLLRVDIGRGREAGREWAFRKGKIDLGAGGI